MTADGKPLTWPAFCRHFPHYAAAHRDELRCPVCCGLGLVGSFVVLTPIHADGTCNGEDVGDRICKDCSGTGLKS